MADKLKYFLQQSWLVIVACCFFGLILAATEAALRPTIEQNKIEKLNRKMSQLLTDAEEFELVGKVTVESLRGKEEELKIYKGVSPAGICGYAFRAKGPGFADVIELVVAVDAEFEKMKGYAILSSNETPGFGNGISESYYIDQFKGAPTNELELVKSGNQSRIDEQIVAISGATISSRAVVNIINNTLTQVKSKVKQKELVSDGE